jgi:hypothetical protein
VINKGETRKWKNNNNVEGRKEERKEELQKTEKLGRESREGQEKYIDSI